MKVTGFSFIKNALIHDYPIVEAIQSILPICDEVVVAVGKSDDDTLNLISEIDPEKIKVIETLWDESLREGGRVLAVETDKAFQAISKETDWAFYIQGDEVIHEKYLDTVRTAMEEYKDDARVDGLLFKYKHFYGSYDYFGTSEKWYKNEIRVVKNDTSIYAYRDAQGFRKGDNQKLNVIPIDAYIYHYGWAKAPEAMQRKQEDFPKLWHDDEWIEKNIVNSDAFSYEEHVRQLTLFKESHPEVMKKRMKEKAWKFECDISIDRRTIKDRIKNYMYYKWGIELGYKNYKIVKR